MSERENAGTREAQIVMYADTFFCEGIRDGRDNAGFINPTKGLFSGVREAEKPWQMETKGPRYHVGIREEAFRGF